MRPRLLTFDIFGTVLDWRRGLTESLRERGIALDGDGFDAVIDAQARLEAGRFRRYEEIVALSLSEVLHVPAHEARTVASQAGRWPLYDDARAALRRLLRVVPCAATTNSDARHGRDVTRELGFDLSGWISAESIRRYKPDPLFWRSAGRRLGREPGRDWWHVSAYADYDLEVARRLGLTCVFVDRPHARPGAAHLTVRDLHDLARRVEEESRSCIVRPFTSATFRPTLWGHVAHSQLRIPAPRSRHRPGRLARAARARGPEPGGPARETLPG